MPDQPASGPQRLQVALAQLRTPRDPTIIFDHINQTARHPATSGAAPHKGKEGGTNNHADPRPADIRQVARERNP